MCKDQKGPIDFFRSGYMKFNKDHFPSALHQSYYTLGKFISYVREIQNKIENAEIFASLFFLISIFLFILLLFGYFFYNIILSILFFIICAIFNTSRLYTAYAQVRKLRNIAGKPISDKTIFGYILTGNEAFIIFLNKFERNAIEYTSARRTLFPEGSRFYLLKNSWLWAILIVIPIYFGISLILSLIQNENGWYNYVGRNFLGG